MGQDSKIEWTTHTFNPWRGCTKISDGCKFCYADALSKRNPKTLGVWGQNGTRVVAAESAWREVVKWNRLAGEAGERHRVFCASLADVFEAADTMPAASLPAVRAARLRLFDLIRTTPHLDWLLLTKRPENWLNVIEETLILSQGGDPEDKNYFNDHDGDFPKGDLAWWLNNWTGEEPPANVWLGTSVENQKTADERIPHLLRCTAAVRFLSCEPLLGRLYIDEILVPFGNDGEQAVICPLTGEWAPEEPPPVDGVLHWVIVGGESGPGARPFNLQWARVIVAQCKAAGVACFVKQMGSNPVEEHDGDDMELCDETGIRSVELKDKKGGDWNEWPSDLRVRQFPASPRTAALGGGQTNG